MGEVARPPRRSEAPEGSIPPGRESPSFEEFFEEEKDRLLRVLAVITASRGEAEDLAQEAFTRMFERWDEIGHMDDLAGYLHRTAMKFVWGVEFLRGLAFFLS
jgi:DNA-directed RNA polymerase specialized sigma24 family protein